jgi:diacylglycerol kinase family enzyme
MTSSPLLRQPPLTSRLTRMYHIVVNPAAGHGKAPKCEWENCASNAQAECLVVEDNVIPLLDRLELQYMSYTTNAPKDAGRIGQEIASGQKTIEGPLKVIVAGGDGTAHELIEGIVGLGDKPEIRKWELIILPLGTVSRV